MYLITPTLINGWKFYMGYKGLDERKNRADFIRLLNRERFEPNEAMLKGIKFENEVKAYCDTGEEPENSIIKEIGDICKNGFWQQVLKKETGNYLLYGKSDVIKGDTIYDIKYTANYEVGKFQDSIQHLLYMYCAGFNKFSYLISDGKEWWKEDYSATKDLKEKIIEKINKFITYLKTDTIANNIFLEKWNSK